MNTKTYQSGQTLLELVIAVGVVAVVITALISAVTASLRYSQATRLRSRGVKYAQEAIELTRKLRDTGAWDAFMAYSDGDGSWCLDELGVWTDDDGSGTCPISGVSNFWRNVRFVWSDPTMEVTARVSWADRSTPTTVELKTNFTQWK